MGSLFNPASLRQPCGHQKFLQERRGREKHLHHMCFPCPRKIVLEAREREKQGGVMKFTHTHIITVLAKCGSGIILHKR
jgi:hypothetical protein